MDKARPTTTDVMDRDLKGESETIHTHTAYYVLRLRIALLCVIGQLKVRADRTASRCQRDKDESNKQCSY